MSELVRLAKEALRQQRSIDPIQPGALIAWQGADGTIREGFVDCIHLDDDGCAWAFVTIGKSWAAVNLKIVQRVPR